jgi:hypothetical protein
MRDDAALNDLLAKKMVTPPVKREAVAHLQGVDRMSERLVCKAIGCDGGALPVSCCTEGGNFKVNTNFIYISWIAAITTLWRVVQPLFFLSLFGTGKMNLPLIGRT